MIFVSWSAYYLLFTISFGHYKMIDSSSYVYFLIQASKLQTTTMEVMEAVEIEKQKHNNTRMEALARLTKLEVS